MPQSNKATYYSLLGLHPSASPIEIRRAYRQLSKCYHPDTTDLPSSVATAKFQQLNEAYATLSNPERRLTYDMKIGYSRFGVIQVPPDLNHPSYDYDPLKSAYLDPSDRPLSAGELFALFILGITFLGCLLLAIFIGLTRGDAAFQTQLTPTAQQQITHLMPMEIKN
ncbi:MAG: J domain-containing protein [Nostocaceae cyanobacterium]|nr:J domain-containing protein [Nostocaceae cyanobacterium]